MRLGINLLFLEPGNTGGTETYVRELLPALEARGVELFVFSGPRGWASVGARLSQARWVKAPLVRLGRGVRVAVEQTWLARAASAYDLDVLFSPGYVAPIAARPPLVTTVPDTLYLDLPQYLPFDKRLYWRLFIPLTIARSRRILTISRSSAASLTARFPRHAGKITVTYLASPFAMRASASPFVARHGNDEREPYVLTVAQHLPHKNLECVVGAVALLRGRGYGVKLVIVGQRGPATASLRRLATSLGGDGWIRWEESLTDTQLEQLYRHATAFVTASRLEGFCLPILEAFALGCPAVCSRIPSLEEICAGAGRHFDPDDTEEAARLVEELLRHPEKRHQLAADGQQRVESFSWAQCADVTLAACATAAARAGAPAMGRPTPAR
jgi:glycosyltransferase involved in cell wall biosynthesis